MMEDVKSSGFGNMVTITKKRSSTARKPRPDFYPLFGTQERSPSYSTPASDSVSKASSDENVRLGASSHRKEFNLNNPSSRFTATRDAEETVAKKSRKGEAVNGEFGGFYVNISSKGSSSDVRRSREGSIASAYSKYSIKVNHDSRNLNGSNGRKLNEHSFGPVFNGFGTKGDTSLQENKLRKVKLKVGGVTKTIHATSSLDDVSGASVSKPPRSLDAPRRQKLILQDNSDDDPSPPDRANGLRKAPWKDGSVGVSKEGSRSKVSEESGNIKQADKSSEPVRKSKRVPKKRVLDGAFDEEEDEELQYLGRLKTAKISTESGVNDEVEEYDSSWKSKDGTNKSRSERESEEADYLEEGEDLGSDGGLESRRKRLKKESVDSLTSGKKEISLTSRQRAIQSCKDGSSGTPTSLIEFPNGLPPAPPRKQKEKLSEDELQLKKAEAAERRRIQVEKANKESQAEAIRKIRGQDSKRKKKEVKQRKLRDELAKEKAANAAVLAADTVRWVMGPNGTVVTFPTDMGLPSIFDSKPCSYPPPREKCAGPSCTNAYKYRDSKTKLPLCSLQCYRAVQQSQPVTTC